MSSSAKIVTGSLFLLNLPEESSQVAIWVAGNGDEEAGRANDLQLQPGTQLTENHPGGRHRASIFLKFLLASPLGICPLQRHSSTRPRWRTTARRQLSLWQQGVTVEVAASKAMGPQRS